MTTTSLSLIDRVEERLAEVWLQMDHIGNARFQEEIEQVSHAFPVPENSPSALRVIQPGPRPSSSGYTPNASRRSKVGSDTRASGGPIANRLGLTQGERPRQPRHTRWSEAVSSEASPPFNYRTERKTT